jgi:hypothetical protein
MRLTPPATSNGTPKGDRLAAIRNKAKTDLLKRHSFHLPGWQDEVRALYDKYTNALATAATRKDEAEVDRLNKSMRKELCGWQDNYAQRVHVARQTLQLDKGENVDNPVLID